MGVLGVIAGVALLIVLALRGVNVIVASLLCASVVAITNGANLADALLGSYSSATFGFAQAFFLVFVAGAVFGRMMSESHAAASIAYALSHALGPQRTLMIGTLVCALLTYGGVNVFIVIFTVYPIGLGLMQRSNTPKRLFMAATSLGAGTFTMTALPGSPSLHNIIMAEALGTPLTAAPVIGIIGSVIMLGLGLLYLEWQRKKSIEAGEGFVVAPTDVVPDEPDPAALPHWFTASVPMIIVLVTIITPMLLHRIAPPAPGAEGAYASLVNMAIQTPIVWTILALSLGTLSGFLLFWSRLKHVFGILGRGAESAVLPLLNTAVIIGFGGVVTATAAFQKFATVMLESGIHPVVSSVLSINLISGIVGSSSGGLRIFTNSLAESYLELGVDPEILHRLVAIGAGGLDSLPHCGAVITTLTIMGLTHKEAYKDTAIVTIVVPLIAVIMLTGGVLIFT